MSDPISEEETPLEDVVAPRTPFFVRALVYVGFLILIAAGLILGSAYLVYEEVTRPGVPGETVEFLVPEGATGIQIAEGLADARLVEHPLLFRLAIRLDDSKASMKHGMHELSRGMSPMELLAALREIPRPEIDPNAVRVTIPEGLTIAQMARTLEDPAGFLSAAASLDAMMEVGVHAPSLEGFLMPNTYYFAEVPTGEELTRRMLVQFKSELDGLFEDIPAIEGEELLRIVTIASLVEEEARVDEERPIIAAVIYNRLTRDRALQMDSTLQYALDKYGQRLLNEDKEVDSPYNTYKYRGLPPGPKNYPSLPCARCAVARCRCPSPRARKPRRPLRTRKPRRAPRASSRPASRIPSPTRSPLL